MDRDKSLMFVFFPPISFYWKSFFSLWLIDTISYYDPLTRLFHSPQTPFGYCSPPPPETLMLLEHQCFREIRVRDGGGRWGGDKDSQKGGGGMK